MIDIAHTFYSRPADFLSAVVRSARQRPAAAGSAAPPPKPPTSCRASEKRHRGGASASRLPAGLC